MKNQNVTSYFKVLNFYDLDIMVKGVATLLGSAMLTLIMLIYFIEWLSRGF